MATKIKLEKSCTEIHVQLLAWGERSVNHTGSALLSYKLPKEKTTDL